jgi:hypothetical protein
MKRFFIFLFIIKLNIFCQQTEDIVPCNDIEINHEEFDQMNIKEQEEFVNKYSLFEFAEDYCGVLLFST